MKLAYADGTVVRLGVEVDVGRRRWKKPRFHDGVQRQPDGSETARDVDVELAFAATMESFREFVENVAFRYAEGDLDLAEELMQQAWIKLWELDPLRYDASDRGFIAKSLRNAILDAARAELGRLEEDDDRVLHVHVRVA